MSATTQASVTTMAGSSTAPLHLCCNTRLLKVGSVVVDANDLASMADTVASNAGIVYSNATPPATTTAIQGSSQLAPVNVNANDLASMADTAYASMESSSDSSSDSSISEDPLEDSPEGYLALCVFHCSGATSAAPPYDMEMELPEEDPDPVMDDTNMPHYSNLPLLSIGDPQHTLGDGPLTAPQRTHFPGSCFGRPRQVGVTHHSWYRKTCHFWYEHLYLPQQII